MKAIVQDRYGSADVLLELRDIDVPVVGEKDVLVRVRAAGCGPEPLSIRRNAIPRPAPAAAAG